MSVKVVCWCIRFIDPFTVYFVLRHNYGQYLLSFQKIKELMAYNFRENNFAVAQFQEIDGWQVAEMTGIQEGIGGEGVVTNFTVLKLKMSEKHESLEESEESNIESSGTRILRRTHTRGIAL